MKCSLRQVKLANWYTMANKDLKDFRDDSNILSWKMIITLIQSEERRRSILRFEHVGRRLSQTEFKDSEQELAGG
jgi:hypothetical protein